MNLSKFSTLLLVTSASTAAFGLGIGSGGSGGAGGGGGGSFVSQTPNGLFLTSSITSGYVPTGTPAVGLTSVRGSGLVPTDTPAGTGVPVEVTKRDDPDSSIQPKDYLDLTARIQFDVGGAGTDSFVISIAGHASAEFATSPGGNLDGHQFAYLSLQIGGGIPGADWSFAFPDFSTYSGPGTFKARLQTYSGGPVPVDSDVTSGGLYTLSPLNSYSYLVDFELFTPFGTDPDFNVSFSGSASTAQPSVPDAGASTGFMLGLVLAGQAIWRRRQRA